MENDLPPNPPPLSGVPPPLGAVPPRFAPPVVQVRRGGRGWMVLALILAVLLGVTWFAHVASFFGSVRGAARHTHAHNLQEVVVKDDEASDKIVVIEVDGIISSELSERGGHNQVESIEEQLKLATEDKAVRAVILKVDSPGGEVLASDDISRAISNFEEETKKPVIAAMGGMAASGGYYISAPCDWIVANELTITGSIGVIMHGFNYRGLMDKVGIRPLVFKSGKFKDMLSGSKSEEETLPEERQMVQSLIDETFAKFKSVVAEGRKRSFERNQGQELSKDWQDYADGRILSGNQAFKLGFVDELGNFEKAVERAKTLADIKSANLVRYEEPFDFSNLLRYFGKTETPALKVDLGMQLPKLQAGRLYFLSGTLFR